MPDQAPSQPFPLRELHLSQQRRLLLPHPSPWAPPWGPPWAQPSSPPEGVSTKLQSSTMREGHSPQQAQPLLFRTEHTLVRHSQGSLPHRCSQSLPTLLSPCQHPGRQVDGHDRQSSLWHTVTNLPNLSRPPVIQQLYS